MMWQVNTSHVEFALEALMGACHHHPEDSQEVAAANRGALWKIANRGEIGIGMMIFESL